ncbi:unnamed protein product, partial [Ectocarpus sp. 8 AP-2014]
FLDVQVLHVHGPLQLTLHQDKVSPSDVGPLHHYALADEHLPVARLLSLHDHTIVLLHLLLLRLHDSIVLPLQLFRHDGDYNNLLLSSYMCLLFHHLILYTLVTGRCIRRNHNLFRDRLLL